MAYDKTFNFLCKDFKNIYKYSIILNEPDLLTRLSKDENKESRVIISSIKLDDFDLIKVLNLPRFFRYTKSDTYMRFYPDKVYLYK